MPNNNPPESVCVCYDDGADGRSLFEPFLALKIDLIDRQQN